MKLTKDKTNTYDDTPEMHKLVFDRVMKFFDENEAYLGEVIMQNDACLMNSTEVFAEIADEIIKFKCVDIEGE